MKKIKIILVIIIFLIIVSSILYTQNSKNTKIECQTFSDCNNLSIPDPYGAGMRILTPCFKGKCQFPSTTTEWLEYCNQKDHYAGDCYIMAAYSALKKPSEKRYWEDAFNICGKYISNNSDHCKLDICYNLGMVDEKANYDNYSIKEQCIKEAIKDTSCSDNKRNGLETDIDCGGKYCSPCEIGEICEENRDCKTLECGSSSISVTRTCLKRCPNGKILDNTPCSCSGNWIIKESEEEWQEKYSPRYYNNKSRYCCNGQVKFGSC